jgi:hypothetical protein
VPLRDKILILHYFIKAAGTPLTGQLITYKELRRASITTRPSSSGHRTCRQNFKDIPARLPETAAVLGGQKTDYGDIAVTIARSPKCR